MWPYHLVSTWDMGRWFNIKVPATSYDARLWEKFTYYSCINLGFKEVKSRNIYVLTLNLRLLFTHNQGLIKGLKEKMEKN